MANEFDISAVRNSFAEMAHQYDEYLNKSPAGRAANAAEFVAARLAALSSDLEQERQERKVADEATRQESRKQNKKSNGLAIAALVLAFIGVLIAGFALWASLTGFSLVS